MEFDFVFSLAVLIMSVVVHEVAHGYAALVFGDKTADLAGRLTLNPLKHLDMWGSVLFPAISYFLGGFIFGWAKPVPVNTYNLRNRRVGELAVSAAGPLSNLSLAVIFGLILRFMVSQGEIGSIEKIIAMIVLTNIVLAIFNLIPIPPLDGSKILSSILPERYRALMEKIEQFGFFAVLLFALVLWKFVTPLVGWLFTLITGVV